MALISTILKEVDINLTASKTIRRHREVINGEAYRRVEYSTHSHF